MGLSSLFGKKKDQGKEPAKKAKAEAVSHGMNDTEAAPTGSGKTGHALGFGRNARDLADATAKKIDQIESEMSRELSQAQSAGRAAADKLKAEPAPAAAGAVTNGPNSRPMSRPMNTVTGQPGNTRPPQVPQGAPKAQQTFIGMGTTTPSVGQSTDILLGDSMLSNAIELSDSITNPAIEEAAILFAYGESSSAIEVLIESIAEGGTNHGNNQAWLMGLELYQATGDKAKFESLAIDYALRFESSAPTWLEDDGKVPSRPQTLATIPSAGPMNILFSGPLDASITPKLDQLKQLTTQHQRLHVDFNQVTSVHGDGAELILRMLSSFGKSTHVLIVHGVDHLIELLSASIEVGQSETAKSLWTLLLDLYRLQGRQAAFEEKSIDYCVTYEVSPPSWEAYPTNIKPDDLTTIVDAVTIVAQQQGELPPDTIALTGELLGKAENDLALLSNFARPLNHVSIDCSALKRVDFTAAGALLNWAVSQQSANKTIEFRKVSYLIGALFIVMGIHEVAQIERR